MVMLEDNIISQEANKQNDPFSIVSELSKTLVGAEVCSIFVYDEKNSQLVPLFSDLDDQVSILIGTDTISTLFLEKKPTTYKNSLAYPILNKELKAVGIMIFDKKETSFHSEDLDLIKPMAHYLSKVIFAMDSTDESLHLRREVSLALHSKNDDISLSIKSDLQELSHNDLFEFNIFNELKHKVQDQREKTFILICTVSTLADIEEIGSNIFDANLTAIFIGPDDDDMILHAGKYNVTSYIPISKYSKEMISQKISDNLHNITKNDKSQSFVSLFIGTTGGTGTTTISTNLANVLSISNPLKNVLYLDLSTTKAISNIFFGIPAPQKTIVDFLEIDDYSEENMLQSGLYQVKNNLYIIPGIQTHMDREDITNEKSEQKIINMIYHLKSLFDFIIIDGGLAKDSELQIAIEEISDQISIVTELTTIHISILQTYYDLMKKAGWKDKVKIIINRENSQNAISLKDASEIINSNKSKDITFDIHIPNDVEPIRECWNYGKLATSEYPNSKFSKAIKNNHFFSDLEVELSGQIEKLTLIQKVFGKK